MQAESKRTGDYTNDLIVDSIFTPANTPVQPLQVHIIGKEEQRKKKGDCQGEARVEDALSSILMLMQAHAASKALGRHDHMCAKSRLKAESCQLARSLGLLSGMVESWSHSGSLAFPGICHADWRIRNWSGAR